MNSERACLSILFRGKAWIFSKESQKCFFLSFKEANSNWSQVLEHPLIAVFSVALLLTSFPLASVVILFCYSRGFGCKTLVASFMVISPYRADILIYSSCAVQICSNTFLFLMPHRALNPPTHVLMPQRLQQSLLLKYLALVLVSCQAPAYYGCVPQASSSSVSNVFLHFHWPMLCLSRRYLSWVESVWAYPRLHITWLATLATL